MANTIASTVTIDKAYFETLLRRAEFHVSGKDLTTPVDLPIVSIPKIDHDNLLRIAQEYTSLRDALHRGGIAPETLEILIRGGEILQPAAEHYDRDHGDSVIGGGAVFNQPQESHLLAPTSFSEGLEHASCGEWGPKKHPSVGALKDKTTFYNRQYSFGRDDNSFPSEPEKDEHFSSAAKEKQQYSRAEQRTILVKNLSDRATHKDIVDIIRGGAVLDIFLRTNERTASVSFVEGTAAQEFMNYVKRNDVYVHGKRVEFAWNDRQFILPGHVANKVGIGATRNLVVRGIHPNITAERLREDLDHIHNLVVIDVSFHYGDAHISLNSVHNSLFARTCMMSRSTYKGMRIEWFPDECAQPLPKLHYVPRREITPLPAKKLNPMVNRFQMLNIDGTEDGSEEDDGNLIDLSSMHHGSNWNARSVAA